MTVPIMPTVTAGITRVFAKVEGHFLGIIDTVSVSLLFHAGQAAIKLPSANLSLILSYIAYLQTDNRQQLNYTLCVLLQEFVILFCHATGFNLIMSRIVTS